MIRKFTRSMTSLLKTKAGIRGRRAYTDRRRASRTSVRLPLKVSIVEADKRQIQHRKPLEAYTKELSSIGLSFVLSEIQIQEFDFMKRHRRLQMVLDLSTRSIEIFATVASVSRFYVNESQHWYVIGVQISQLNEEDRGFLQGYLTHLSNPDEVLFEDLAFLE